MLYPFFSFLMVFMVLKTNFISNSPVDSKVIVQVIVPEALLTIISFISISIIQLSLYQIQGYLILEITPVHTVSALFDTIAPQTMSYNCIAHQIMGLETFQEISFVNVFLSHTA